MNKKQKIGNILKYLGIALIVVALAINVYNVVRLILAIVGYLCLVLSIILNKDNKLYYKILSPILLLFIVYCIDYSLFMFLHKVPALIYEIKSSDTMSTYNSLTYRIYSCDGKLIHDKFYKNRYQCDENDLKAIDINDFLQTPKENYKNYKGKFIKLTGKISKIQGSSILELKKYVVDASNTLNGYVVFNDAYVVKTEFDNEVNLTNQRIYDEVSVIGKVDTLVKENGEYVINLTDSVFIPSSIYKTFTVETKKNSDDSKSLLSDNYYMTGLDHFYIKYNDKNIYELKYALLDKRVTLKDFIDVDLNTITENTLFEKDNYNILVCANKEVLFGSKKLKKDNINCPVAESSVK
jgi:hypothetical protein